MNNNKRLNNSSKKLNNISQAIGTPTNQPEQPENQPQNQSLNNLISKANNTPPSTNNSASTSNNSSSSSYSNNSSSSSNNSSSNSNSSYSNNSSSSSNNSGNNASKNNRSNNNASRNNRSNNNASRNNRSSNNASRNNKGNNTSSNSSNNASKNNNTSSNNSKNNNKTINNLLEELESESKNNNSSKNNNNSKNNNTYGMNNMSNNKNNNSKNNTRPENIAVNAINNAAESSIVWTILKIIMIGVVFIILINVIKHFYTTYENYKVNSPWLLEGNKNAKHALIISQNPDNDRTPKITRSDGQNGIEFTYNFWMMIEDFNYRQSEWKHVFHKGNESAYPTIAPGVWIHPNKNMLRIYMNSLKKIYEYIDIDDIPLRKWLHIVIIVKNKHMEVYINGYLKVKHELSSLPRQNNEDLWINLNGGFEGYVSRMRYFNYAITPVEIADIIKDGPADSACIDTAEIPPYLDDNWWF